MGIVQQKLPCCASLVKFPSVEMTSSAWKPFVVVVCSGKACNGASGDVLIDKLSSIRG